MSGVFGAPSRPATIEFERMARIVRELDDLSESEPQAISQVLDDLTDEASVMYLAEQRLMRLESVLPALTPLVRQALVATWLEGFSVGARYAERFPTGDASNGP